MYVLTLYLVLVTLADLELERLASPSFEVRQDAQRVLEALGGLARPALAKGANSDDLEISRRCERALCKLKYFGLARMPRIDCLPEAKGIDQIRDRKNFIRTGLTQARREIERKIPDIELCVQRRATARLAEFLLNRGAWSRSRVRKLLLEMEKIEEERKTLLDMERHEQQPP
jgi:hypothetical protein